MQEGLRDYKMVYYFAYGSNLNVAQLIIRIGKWKSAKKAKLTGYKLIFNCDSSKWGGKTANLIETKNKEDFVYGVLYEVSDDQLRILTIQYENVEPKPISVISDDNKTFSAQTYFFNNKKESGIPPKNYFDTMIEGLLQHGYDEEIINKIKGIARL